MILGVKNMRCFTIDWTLRKGYLALDFYRFCRRKDKKLILHYWKYILLQCLCVIHLVSKETVGKQKWAYIQYVHDLEEMADLFWERKGNLYRDIVQQISKKDLILEDAPMVLLKSFCRVHHIDCNIQGISLDANHTVIQYASRKQLLESCIQKYSIDSIICNDRSLKADLLQVYPVILGRICFTKKCYYQQLLWKIFYDISYLALIALSVTIITLLYATIYVRWDLLFTFIKDPLLLFMNWLPIFLLLCLFYGITGSRTTSFFLGSTIIFVLVMINYFKLLYRDEPFRISDILLIQEAGDMAGKYDISFQLKQWFTILAFLMATCEIHASNMKLKIPWFMKIGCTALVVFIGAFAWNSFYLKSSIYDTHGDKTVMNRWSGTQMFQARGVIYPLLYSYTYAIESTPEFYNEKDAEQVLQAYSYEHIPENQKVNIIGIMLESYNDFSKFDSIDFLIDPYENFHALQKESISGNIVTNIFAGGTVATERSFLNGYQNQPGYRSKTNSFTHYFNEQGYYTEALHPSYGWFYNRRNINEYLGFQNFYYIENYFQKIVDDKTLFPEIIKGYEHNLERNQPYFNFTVTYQNHGPYAEKSATKDEIIVRKDGVEDAEYHLLNNYLSGVYKTDQALKDLFDYFRKEEQPVVIVVFGDHNPLLGDGNSGYLQHGINLDLSTLEGFQNYYETPYIFWGNDAAKEVLQSDFSGEGESFSPLYLMPKLFEAMGYTGNEYMQYLSDQYEQIPVMNSTYYQINGEWTQILNDEQQKLYHDFVNVEYYYSHNFWNH